MNLIGLQLIISLLFVIINPIDAGLRPFIRPVKLTNESLKADPECSDVEIAGGSDASRAAFPSLVAIKTLEKDRVCSGVLIKPNLVLAPGCVFHGGKSKGSLAVAPTIHHPAKWQTNHVKRYLSERACFSKLARYSGGEFRSLWTYQDHFAIIRLAEDVQLSDTVKLAELPTEPFPMGEKAHAIGFGITFDQRRSNNTVSQSDTLQVLPVVSADCEPDYNYEPHICFKSNTGKVCQEQSGGPVMKVTDGVQKVVAFASFITSEECKRGSIDKTGVFVDVFSQLDEIKKLIEKCSRD